MRKILTLLAAAGLSFTAVAGEMATPDEAKAMSEKAQATVNDMGKEKAIAAFSAEDGGFMEKDLYVFCVDMEGVIVSHAKKPQLVGKNLIDFNKYGDEPVQKHGRHGQGQRQWLGGLQVALPGHRGAPREDQLHHDEQRGLLLRCRRL